MFTTVFLQFALTIFRHYNGFSLSFPFIFICQHGIATNYYFHSSRQENNNLIVQLISFFWGQNNIILENICKNNTVLFS